MLQAISNDSTQKFEDEINLQFNVIYHDMYSAEKMYAVYYYTANPYQ